MTEKRSPVSGETNDCRTTELVAGRQFLYVHPNAVDVGECYEGCCDKYECPDCGTRFTVEAAQ